MNKQHFKVVRSAKRKNKGKQVENGWEGSECGCTIQGKAFGVGIPNRESEQHPEVRKRAVCGSRQRN